MIFTPDELEAVSAMVNLDKTTLNFKLNGIEDFIRAYTNNTFVVRGINIYTSSSNGKLDKVSPILSVGDTMSICKPEMNKGVYVLKDLDGTLDKSIFDADNNTVHLVKYPEAIKSGVVSMLQYNAKMDKKIGISSESLSRHSVSYAQNNGSDSIGGYPAYIMSFLKPYMKARF